MTGNFRVNVLFSVSSLQLLFQLGNSLLPPGKCKKCGSSCGGVCDTHKLNDRVSNECVLDAREGGGHHYRLANLQIGVSRTRCLKK